MGMFDHMLPTRIGRLIGTVMDRQTVNSAMVRLCWNGAAAPANPNDADTYNPKMPMSEVLPALVHWISARTIARGYTDYQAGDALITFEGAQDLASRNGLAFLLPDGLTYVQTAAGKGVNEFWDVMLGGERMTTTVAIRPNPSTERVVSGMINYLEEDGTSVLYDYDPVTRTFGARNPNCLPWTASLLATPGLVTIAFGAAAPVFVAAASGLAVTWLKQGTRRLQELPRLDFLLGGTLVAQLGNSGVLWVPEMVLSAVNPRGANPRLNALEFAGSDGVWVASMAIEQSFAPAVLVAACSSGSSSSCSSWP